MFLFLFMPSVDLYQWGRILCRLSRHSSRLILIWILINIRLNYKTYSLIQTLGSLFSEEYIKHWAIRVYTYAKLWFCMHMLYAKITVVSACHAGEYNYFTKMPMDVAPNWQVWPGYETTSPFRNMTAAIHHIDSQPEPHSLSLPHVNWHAISRLDICSRNLKPFLQPEPLS